MSLICEDIQTLLYISVQILSFAAARPQHVVTDGIFTSVYTAVSCALFMMSSFTCARKCCISQLESILLVYIRMSFVICINRTTTVLWPFFWDHPGELVTEENFWTLWYKERLIEADTLTTWLGATPSRLTSTHLHHPPIYNCNMY